MRLDWRSLDADYPTMAHFFAAMRVRGLAVLAPVAAVLALAFAAGPATALTLDPPTVPEVHAPPATPAPVKNVVGPVTDTANQATRQVSQAVGNARGGNNGGNSGSGSGGSGGGGSGGPTATGGGTSGGGGGGRAGGSGGSGAKSKASRARARRAAARRAARRRAAAAAAAKARAGRHAIATPAKKDSSSGTPGVLRPIRDIVKVIPTPIKILIGVLAVLAAAFFVRSFLVGRRARRLERDREELLGDVGLLQRALLPEVPDRIGKLDTSVSYRPAEGPGAGGDFYDVFEMEGGRVGIIVGDVCGHGRQALAVTALMRYSLRAYLNAGGEPRTALQIAARALENEPHAELTTVVLAVYDAGAGTLSYACAGHEPPILLGLPAHKPVTVGSSPPIGAGLDTGLRQTTVSLPPGSSAFFFTDGLVEARLGDGLLGRERLAEIAGELAGDARADALLARIAEEADRAPDDMAACIVRATADARQAAGTRIEDLELEGGPSDEERARGFLEACGMPDDQAAAALRSAAGAVAEFGGAILRVRLDAGEGRVEVVPREPTLGLTGNGTSGSQRASGFSTSPHISL
jgi:hypothetical protein